MQVRTYSDLGGPTLVWPTVTSVAYSSVAYCDLV